jgi:hypothetical protein
LVWSFPLCSIFGSPPQNGQGKSAPNPALNADAALSVVFSFVISQSPVASFAVRGAQRRLALRWGS